MQQFDVLSRDLVVWGPHFVEASAGTGKTFAMEHFFTRLLLEERQPLTVDQILVVTFTRAATRELKGRIRRTLMRTHEGLLKGEPSVDYLQALYAQGKESVQLALKKIENALSAFDAAQIFTIHGFCFRSLKEFAVDANVLLSHADPEHKEYLPFLKKTIKEYLKTELRFPEYSAYQIQLLLKRYRFNVKALLSALISKIESGTPVTPLPNFFDHHRAFHEALQQLPATTVTEWTEEIARVIASYKKMQYPKLPVQIQIWGELLEHKRISLEQFEEILQMDCFLEGLDAHNLKVRAKMHFAPSILIGQVRHALLPLVQSAKDPRKIFLRLVYDLRQVCLPALEKQDAFPPDALLRKVEQALSSPSFVKGLQSKYRAVIVDEFQDTDPVQWKIIETLFLSSDALCLVGDPKQSIYGFRSADVYTYLHAKEKIGQAAQQGLYTNYRSSAALIHALNALFGKAPKGWMPLPSLGKMLDVPSVNPSSVAIEGSIKESPLTFFLMRNHTKRSRQFPSKETEEGKLFPYIAQKILDLHETQGVPYHHIAILVKDRFQGRRVLEHLKTWGIASALRRGSSIMESHAYAALQEVLLAVLFPQQMGRLKAALGSCLIGRSEQDLKRTGEDPALLDAKASMYKLHNILIEQGFAAFFQAFLHTPFFGKTVYEHLMQGKELELFFDLRFLCQELIEAQLQKGLNAEQLLAFLQHLKDEVGEENSLVRGGGQEETECVAIMTTHMSKGLEFDAVFALGVVSRHSLVEEVVVNRQLTLLDREDPLCVQALDELNAEKMRQFYVALTRAKRRIYVPCIIDDRQKGEGDPSSLELFLSYCHVDLEWDSVVAFLQSLQPLLCVDIVEESVVRPAMKTRITSLPILIPPSPFSVRHQEKFLCSFSSLHRISQEEPLPMALPLEPSMRALPLGSLTGQLIHRLLEKVFKYQLHCKEEMELLVPLIAQETAHTPLEPFQSILLPWLQQIFNVSLGHFAIKDILPSHYQQEMEFYFPCKKGLMKGYIDLAFECNGKYYVLDWKTNYLGPNSEDYCERNIIKAMDANDYWLQAAIYKEALRRYVKLFDMRSFDAMFGGAIYFFVRGNTPYIFNVGDSDDLF